MILIAAGIGEFRSPASACFPVGTVVIPGDGAGDQPVESPEVNVLDGWLAPEMLHLLHFSGDLR